MNLRLVSIVGWGCAGVGLSLHRCATRVWSKQRGHDVFEAGEDRGTDLLRIPRKVRSLEPSLCCSSVTVDVSTVGGAVSADDAMMAPCSFDDIDLRFDCAVIRPIKVSM